MTAVKLNIAECMKTVKSIVTKVLVLVLAVLFFQNIVIGFDSSFHKYF